MKESNINDNNSLDLVALVVHKLKTPISSIKLCLEMLLEGDFGELNEEQKKVLQRTYQRNNVLIAFVNDLLNLAKIKGKKMGYNPTLVNFEGLVQLIVDSEQEEIEKKHLNVIVKKPAEKFPKLKLDKEKVFLVVQNVIDNAIRYSNIGGEVVISFNKKGKHLYIQVKDNGIGIPEKEKEKVFTEFFRGTNAKEAEPLGSGVGLYIARGIVEDRKGSIWFESKEGKGTTFFIDLPLS